MLENFLDKTTMSLQTKRALYWVCFCIQVFPVGALWCTPASMHVLFVNIQLLELDIYCLLKMYLKFLINIQISLFSCLDLIVLHNLSRIFVFNSAERSLHCIGHVEIMLRILAGDFELESRKTPPNWQNTHSCFCWFIHFCRAIGNIKAHAPL